MGLAPPAHTARGALSPDRLNMRYVPRSDPTCYGLARLREQLGDPLFVRGPAGMVATRFAEEAYLSFSEGLARI
jgi:hypothetical protein